MQTFQVLSTHHTIAEYMGIVHVPCRHLTSLCPDRCTHAFDAGQFKILSYEQFEKPGAEGDEQQTLFIARLDSNEEARMDYQFPEFASIVQNLVPGQKVKLYWEHVCMTDETRSRWPARPIRSIEIV
jgi:hypothetical protein